MRDTTAGQLLINAALPDDMQDYNRVLDKKGVQQLLDEVARKYPERYAEVVKNLSDVGRHVAYSSGGFGVGLRSLRQTQAAKTARANLTRELYQVYSNRNLSPQDADAAVLETVGKYQKALPGDVFKEAVGANNPLAMQAVSGARGNQTNVNSLIGSDLLYEDHRGRPVPIPILRNYSMGLSPAEHFAGAFGARKGTLDLKKATADAGFLCLWENTEVRMADGTTRRIKDIVVGDIVLGADKSARVFPVAVTAVFDNGDRELYAFTFARGMAGAASELAVVATMAHKVAGKHTFKKTQPGYNCCYGIYRLCDMRKDTTCDSSIMTVRSAGASTTGGVYEYTFQRSTLIGSGNTRDIEVDHPDHLFVLANGAVVSNSKQLAQAAHRLLVTATDADTPYDESQPRGLEVSTDDADSEGSLLAHPVGGYPRNTVLTPKILKELRSDGHDNILVRSPTVGGPIDGGVYSRDTGYRERGGLAPRGDMVGLAGAQAISEPVTQGQISSKHSGGVAGASAGAIGGFSAINAMVQAPEIFPGGAVHSQMDGRVEHIVEAPQGGHYATVGGQQHYIPRGAVITAKKGDEVEAGDMLTEGIPNPAEIVRHKGIGEGRKYFIESFRKVLKNSQIGAHRRNVELLARGLLNHVRLTDEIGDWGPDDVVPYQTLESQWTPRSGYLVAPAKSLVGHYLERPVLHYSVGTKIRPSMVQKLDQYGVKSVYAHPDAPPFEPEMVRAMMNTAHDPDWQTKMLGSYQQGSVLEAARRGGVSDPNSTSYVPSLAGSPTFGSAKLVKGWNPADIGRKPVDVTKPPTINSILD